ncbi:protein jagged-1-like, partial [Saccostrea cucullata]|uniref:protein jagged-1-like n=1 Tax=Saccostrea cuccullata TaxID=36930 RepID=UPI002ED4708E
MVGGQQKKSKTKMSSSLGSLMIKVEIWDYDDLNDDDFIAFLYRVYSTYAGLNVTSAVMIDFSLTSANTGLLLGLKVYCDEDYFGINCSTHCRSRDGNFGHYNCDPNSGSKVCLKGWQGTNCTVQIQENHCQSSPCSNNGTCLNSYGGFRCICVKGFN